MQMDCHIYSLPEQTDNTGMSHKTTSMFNISQVEAVIITSLEIRSVIKKDKVLSRVYCYSKRGWPDIINDSLKAYHQCWDELAVERNCLMWGMCHYTKSAPITNPERATPRSSWIFGYEKFGL